MRFFALIAFLAALVIASLAIGTIEPEDGARPIELSGILQAPDADHQVAAIAVECPALLAAALACPCANIHSNTSSAPCPHEGRVAGERAGAG